MAHEVFERSFYYKVIFLVVIGLAIMLPFLNFSTYSNSIDDLERQLIETEEQKAIKQKILKETEAEVNSILNSSWSLSQKIAALEDQIKSIEQNIEQVKEDILLKEAEIAEQEEKIDERHSQMEEISKRLYINSRINLIDLLVGTEAANDIIRSYVLKKYTFNRQVRDVENLNFELSGLANTRIQLNNQKSTLEAEDEALAEAKEVLAEQRGLLQDQLSAQNAARGQLQNEITLLNNKITELQEAILIARSGSFVPSVGSIPSGADFNGSAEGFRTLAPAGYFSIFSFGAYTHRVGMSQYGALGRANSGQNVNQILQAYFNKLPVQRDTSGTINVQGHGNLDFETTYLYGIAEMPASWPMEALKAQAIVARSFAYRYKVENKMICTTQSCQVFLVRNNPQSWIDAVDATRGMILEDAPTYYSSTTGGYLSSSGWDTTDGLGGGNWTERAYESIAGSPWFYKAWYRNGYSASSDDCGRGNPWLSESEMADLINTWLVMKRNGVVGNVDDSRILPVTINSCNYGGWRGNPYSMEEMRSLLANPVTSISGYPALNFSAQAQTATVSFSTNRGVVTIPGMEFKSVFNTRAPAFLAIPQSSWAVDFAFFNIERK